MSLPEVNVSLPDVSLDGSTDLPAAKQATSPHRAKAPAATGEVSDLDADEVTDLKTRQGSDSKPARPTAMDGLLYLLRYGADQVTGAAAKAGSHRGGFADARPESWNQFRARVAARGWLPEGYDGWFLKKAPAAFYNTVGSVGWAAGTAVVWLCTHMLAFIAAFIVTVTAVALWFIFS